MAPCLLQHMVPRDFPSQNMMALLLVLHLLVYAIGNDLSRVFAPLLRDGRMEKFYWNPERDDVIAILKQMYKVRRDPMYSLGRWVWHCATMLLPLWSSSIFPCMRVNGL